RSAKPYFKVFPKVLSSCKGWWGLWPFNAEGNEIPLIFSHFTVIVGTLSPLNQCREHMIVCDGKVIWDRWGPRKSKRTVNSRARAGTGAGSIRGAGLEPTRGRLQAGRCGCQGPAHQW